MEVDKMKMYLKGGILLLFLLSACVTPGCTTETAHTATENMNVLSSQLDFTEMTEDSQGEGWIWEAGTKTLRLNGLNLYWDGEDLSGGEAIVVPEDTTIILEDGSVNVIQSKVPKKLPCRNMVAINCDGKVTFDGKGSLEIAGMSQWGIEANFGDIIINNGTYIFSGTSEYSFSAGGDFVINQGDIEITDGSIVVDGNFIINGGNVATNENFFPVRMTDGNFILNDGCFKVISDESRENETERDFQIIVSNEHQQWIINGGEFSAAGITLDSSLTVNGGYMEVDGGGLNVGITGQYIQHGGTVVIRSDYQGIDNQMVLSLDNRDKKRFIITGGELQVTTRDPQYGAVEFIAENGTALADYIEVGENMICEPTEWIVISGNEYPFIRQRNIEQYMLEEKEYQILTLKTEGNLQEGQFPGAQTVTIRER